MNWNANCKKTGVFFRKHIDILICTIIVAVIFFLTAAVFEILLISPDDAAYQNIMSGTTMGVPDAHCYFLRYPLAAFLTFLYKLDNRVAWYQLFLLSSLAWCFFLIFSLAFMLCHIRKILYYITSVFAVLLLFMTHLIHVEWTITSGILGMTAIFRYMTMPSEMPRRSKIREYGSCIFLLLFSFCIRHTVAFMLFPLMGICWLRKVQKLRMSMAVDAPPERCTQIRDQVMFLILCLLTTGTVMLIHTHAYASEEWQAYKEYTKDRSVLFDYYGYPDFDTYADVYEKAGITREACDLMRADYNYVIPCDNFKSINLKTIANLSGEIYRKDFIKNMMKLLQETLFDLKYLVLNSLILLLFFCNCSVCSKREKIFFIGAVILWAVVLAGYLAYKGRLPERVMKCIYYGILGVLSGNLFDSIGLSAKEHSAVARILNIMCCIFLISMIGVEFPALYRENCENAALARSKIQLLQYCKEHPQNEYFRDFGSFSQRGELVMRRGYDAANCLGIGGWTYNSPIFQKSLESRGIEDIYAAIHENQNIYYLVSQERADKVIKRLNAYFISEGKAIRMRMGDKFQTESETVIVLKFKSPFDIGDVQHER